MPVPICLCKAFTHVRQSSQPHEVGTFLSPFDESLGQSQQGSLTPNPELSTCPEIPGGKPEKNSDLYYGLWVRTDKWLWVNLYQVDSSFQTFSRLLGCYFPSGTGRWMSKSQSKDLQTNDFDWPCRNLQDYSIEVHNLKPGSHGIDCLGLHVFLKS